MPFTYMATVQDMACLFQDPGDGTIIAKKWNPDAAIESVLLGAVHSQGAKLGANHGACSFPDREPSLSPVLHRGIQEGYPAGKLENHHLHHAGSLTLSVLHKKLQCLVQCP
jgi:hypothetical protein